MFYVKLAMIALAFVEHDRGREVLAPRGRCDRRGDSITLRTLAMLSLVLWTAAIVAGRLLAYQ